MKYESKFEKREGIKYYIGKYTYKNGEESTYISIFEIVDNCHGMILKDTKETTGNDAWNLFENYCM